MKNVIVALFLCAFIFPADAFSKEALEMIVSDDVQATLVTVDAKQRVSGKLNAHIRINERNQAKIVSITLALFKVDQTLILMEKPKSPQRQNTGVFGFVGKHNSAIKYDVENGVLAGKVKGQVDVPWFREFSNLKVTPEQHVYPTLTQPASIDFSLTLDKEAMAKAIANNASDSKKPTRMKGDIQWRLNPGTTAKLKTRDYRLSTELIPVDIVVGFYIEAVRKLCVQPVRIETPGTCFSSSPSFSGDGLNFGMPGADTQWRKADVIFEVRDWITIQEPQYGTFSMDELTGLLATVDEDDCIEVFFVNEFDPQTLWGGGGTVSSGQASAKIVSSDENADFGVDFTHLAHELGHVMSLMHPGSGTATDGSTNTLMCPSGFNNDNPQRNSQWNEDTVDNPLFQISFAITGPAPDCQNDADCGACP